MIDNQLWYILLSVGSICIFVVTLLLLKFDILSPTVAIASSLMISSTLAMTMVNKWNLPMHGSTVLLLLSKEGYNKIIERLLNGIEVRTNVDYLQHKDEYNALADKILFTGPIDEFYDFKLGTLEYRGLRFETEQLEEDNHQGVAVVNYTEREIPYTRIIEHKHFVPTESDVTYITKEYPADWKIGEEAYYPVNDERNYNLYDQYVRLAKQEDKVLFGGRLGQYKYYDMDKVILEALRMAESELY